MKINNFFCWHFVFSLLILHIPVSYAGSENCPKEAIHCVHNTLRNDESKWLKIIMLPKNITMIVCIRPRDVIYLEKDDIEHDAIKPGTILTWLIYQCRDEPCAEMKPISIDQFALFSVNNQYYAKPSTFALNVDPSYGASCKPFSMFRKKSNGLVYRRL
jgi:hypothetical protein